MKNIHYQIITQQFDGWKVAIVRWEQNWVPFDLFDVVGGWERIRRCRFFTLCNSVLLRVTL